MWTKEFIFWMPDPKNGSQKAQRKLGTYKKIRCCISASYISYRLI